MVTNLEALHYPTKPESKVHLWNAATTDERYAQNEFLNRLGAAVAGPVAAKVLDWEIALGENKKTSLRTVLRWIAADFADVKARLDALATLVGQSGGGVSLSKEEQAEIYERAVRESLGTYDIVRRVETPSEEEG